MTRNNWRMAFMAGLASVLLGACSGDEVTGVDANPAPPSGGSTSAPIDTGTDPAPANPGSAAPDTGTSPLPPVPPSQPENPSTPAPPPTAAETPPPSPQDPQAPVSGSQPPVAGGPEAEAPGETPPPAGEVPAANTPPSISGSAAASTLVGAAYSFSPAAADPDGDALSWSVTGKPADAAFSTVTGELSWTPQSAGVWSDIVITVTDSKGASSSLQPFSITVEQPVVHGRAALRWEAPVAYSDGTAMPADALAGYRIYHGTSETTLASVAEVDSLTTSLTIDDLEKGMHYFAVKALSAGGEEGERSAILSKAVP